MDTQTFFENFTHLADAPNGVKKLRELILQLAVRGKLVPQDSNDEPAAKLLERIQEKKALLVKEKKIRNLKVLPKIESEETVHNLPDCWVSVRLGEIGDWGAGSTPDRKSSVYYDGNIPWFKSGELNDGHIHESEEKISDAALQKFSLRLNKPGDVLIAMYGTTIGKVAILDVEGTTNQAVCACTCYDGIDNEFLLLTLKACKPFFIGQGAGGAQPNISREKIIHTIVPLPPLAEQHRIVAKVDQLMSLSDELENRQQKMQKKLVRLNTAALDRLTSASKADEFIAAWQLVRDNFDLLYTTPETIAKLRQSILQLAVQGKLVPQDPNDEPASALLKKIKTEKERLVKEKKIRKSEPLPPVSADEVPYELPQGWEIQRYVELADIVGGVTKGRNLVGRGTASFSYLRVANVQRGYLALDVMKEIEIPVEELEKYKLSVGDLLTTEGGDWDKVGRTAIWDCQIDVCIHQNHVFRARLFDDCLSRFWVMQYINSSQGRRYFEKASKQTTNLASINMTQLRNCPIPIPPLGEQQRIITKLNQLMGLCDNLESRLTKTQCKADTLIASTVQSLLAA
jgi:type I restriction enzyme S subunit